MTPLDQLLALNGPLGGKLGAEPKKGQPSSADGGVGKDEGGGEALLLRHILSLWGRQLLLALQAAHKRGILLRTLRLSHILVSSDGRRIKLGPSALANFALTDGSTLDGGGRVLSANELPPLRGPISSAMAAAPRADLAAARASTGVDEVLFAKPLVRSMPDALPSAAFTRASASGWGAQALEGMVGAPLEEAMLPPELLARTIVPSEGVAGPDGNPRGAWRDSKGSEFLSASIDLWNVGRFLFESYYGEPPADYATSVLEHCTALGLDPRAAVPTILAATLEPLPAHHRATTLPAAAPPSRPRTAVEELEAREAAAAELSEVGAAAAEATAAAAASLPPAEGERSRSLVPVPPFTYDPFATLKAKARRSAERAHDDASTSGRPTSVVVGARLAHRARARGGARYSC
jgi:serine/threonine protein kinase